jgi:DNA-binding GntR family transcriptional regulator
MAVLKQIAAAPDLTERVHAQLLEAICAGELAPGARVTQEELAASLGVSRQPVNQALRLLKKEGFLVDAGKRGLMVSPLDGRAVGQLYEVRAVLDGLAARLAAQARRRIDPALIAEGRRAATGSNLRAMIRADMKFHDAIYAASGNQFITDSAARHWQHIGRAMGAFLQPQGMGATVWNEHQAILEAINSGDAARAESLARGHCEAAGSNLSSQLETPKEKSA